MKPKKQPLLLKVCYTALLAAGINCAATAGPADTAQKSNTLPHAASKLTIKLKSAAAPDVPGVNKVSEINGFVVKDISSPNTNVAGKQIEDIVENSQITITITNPKDFLRSRPSDTTPLILFVDGFPLHGITTDYFTGISAQYLNDPTKNWPKEVNVPFLFTRDSTNEAAWIKMFKLTKWNKNKISVKISAGWQGMIPLDLKPGTAAHNLRTVIFYRKGVFWIFSACYLAFLILFAYYCYTSGLIRDPDVVNNTPGPFSLAQTQLAYWTVIVIGGFCYLWLLTGQADSINNSILLLLGISVGTTGTASFIDYYKKTASQNAAVPVAGTCKQHRNFLQDILSDGVNMSVQRAQTTLWNFVLGLYFLWYVVTNKSMPDFNSTLLVLAGVSSGLYVVSKPTENPPAPAPAATAAAPAANPADVSNSAQHEF